MNTDIIDTKFTTRCVDFTETRKLFNNLYRAWLPFGLFWKYFLDVGHVAFSNVEIISTFLGLFWQNLNNNDDFQ